MSKQAVTHRLKQMEGLWLLSKALADAKVLRRNGSGKNRGLEIQAAIRDILLRELNRRQPRTQLWIDLTIGILADPSYSGRQSLAR